MTATAKLREQAETEVDPDRSVTCAICGGLADERRSVTLDPEQIHAAAPESFERIGRVFTARAVFGEGEVHEHCLQAFNEKQ